MLQEPSAFNTAVQAILAAQNQAIAAGSKAGGKHLCFLGSGRDDEDRYVYMVVASFLQKHHLFVSLAQGGYAAVHSYVLRNNCLDKFIVDHNKKQCLCCKQPQSFIKTSPMGSKSLSSSNSSIAGSQLGGSDSEHYTTSIFDRMTSVVKSRAIGVKEKLVDYIVNPNLVNDERHVSAENVGRRYRGSNVFSLFDVDSGGKNFCFFLFFCYNQIIFDTFFSSFLDVISSGDSSELEFNVEEWCKSQKALGCFRCEELTDDGKRYPRFAQIVN